MSAHRRAASSVSSSPHAVVTRLARLAEVDLAAAGRRRRRRRRRRGGGSPWSDRRRLALLPYSLYAAIAAGGREVVRERDCPPRWKKKASESKTTAPSTCLVASRLERRRADRAALAVAAASDSFSRTFATAGSPGAISRASSLLERVERARGLCCMAARGSCSLAGTRARGETRRERQAHHSVPRRAPHCPLLAARASAAMRCVRRPRPRKRSRLGSPAGSRGAVHRVLRGEVARARPPFEENCGALLQMGEDAWRELGVESAIASRQAESGDPAGFTLTHHSRPSSRPRPRPRGGLPAPSAAARELMSRREAPRRPPSPSCEIRR